MKEDGPDIGAGVESVLVEVDCATCVKGHVEAINEKLLINVVRRLLELMICLERVFLSASGPRVPVEDDESPVHNSVGRKMLVDTVQDLVRAHLDPPSEMICS